MVARKNHARGPADGNPAGGLKGLGGLVDEQRAKLHALQQSAARTHKGGGDDARLAKDLAVDAYDKLRLTVFQPLQLLVAALAAALGGAKLAHGLAYGP